MLREHLDIFVIVYLDNILIYSKNEEDHWKHIRTVLTALEKADLQIKSEKSQFHQEEIEFLEYIITNKEIKIDSEKVRVIMKWPAPKSVKEVQVFLRFINFYWKFILHYLRVTASLTGLMKKKQVFI